MKHSFLNLLPFLVTLIYAQFNIINKLNVPPPFINFTIEEFQAKYFKNYQSPGEKIYRTIVFEKNKQMINRFNKNALNSYYMGENQFLDMTAEEFLAKYSGFISSDPTVIQNVNDTAQLQVLNARNCSCNPEQALRKSQLEQRINQSQRIVDSKVRNYNAKNKQILDRIDINIANLTKLFNLLNPVNYQNANASKLNQLNTLDAVKSSAINVITPDVSTTETATTVSSKSTPLPTNTPTTSINTVPISPPSSTQISISPFQSSGIFASGSTPRNLATLEDVDWSNVTGPVRFQGNCGACYAFASINVLEAANAIFLYGGTYVQLSVQQVIDCAILNYNGCSGGLLQWGFSYMKTTGITTNYRYPYTSGTSGKTGTCKNLTGNFKVLSHQTINNSCISLRNELQKKPVATAIKSKGMQFYSKGVYTGCQATDTLNHAVVIVAYNSTFGWKFKNTWGTTWGQSGYGWLSLEQKDNCGICQTPVVPRVNGEII